MTVTQQGPDDISHRATRSGAAGYRADTDDWLHDIEHDEQRIDPNREAGGRSPSSARGPMMMPPMMGGMGGGAGAGGAAGLGGMGGAGALNAARLGAGSQPVAPTPLPGTGQPMPGGSNPGGGPNPFGGGTRAAGGTGAGGGIDIDGDGIVDKFPNGGIDTDGDGIPGTFPDRAGLISSDAEDIGTKGKGWAGISERMDALKLTASQRHAQTNEFGLVTNPHEQYNSMSTAVQAWSTSASREFGVMSQKLAADAQSYRDTASAQTAQSKTIHQE